MWASFTTGTYPFLSQLAKRHKKESFYFMQDGHRTLLYYEHRRRKSIFVSGHTYKIVEQDGQFIKKGYVTMHHLPIAENGSSLFEDQVKQRFPQLTRRTGVLAMRLLKHQRKTEYILLTLWESKRDEERWKESPFYEEENVQRFAPLSAYFLESPFTKAYSMIDDDEDEEDAHL